MFLKRIFGKPPPPKPEVEKLSLESLRDRVAKLRTEKTENCKKQLDPVIDKISRARSELSDSLKELVGSEPSDDIHPALLKSATEARKLLSDKVSRAISNLGRPQDFSGEGLSAFDERVSKAFNLISDAMTTHGRYVRSVFEQKFSPFETSLRELHELVIQLHAIVEGTAKEIRALDSILSEIAQQTQLDQDLKKTRDDTKNLESRVQDIELHVKDETSKLAELKSGEEFKRAADSAKGLEQTQREINKLKEKAVSHVSEMSRPFRKMEKLVASGGHPIESGTVKTLKICINNPVEVISSDENILALEKLLQEISKLINAGNIDLNEREKRTKLIVAQKLASELKNIRRDLANLSSQLESQRKSSENPILGQAVKLEKLIAQHEYELRIVRTSIGELGKKSKLIEDEMASKRGKLGQMASDAIGAKVELTF